MIRENILFKVFFAITLFCGACNQESVSKFSELEGPYLGQNPPGVTAGIFAPGILSTSMNEGMISFNCEGTEVYFGTGIDQPHRVYMFFHSQMQNGKWIEPVEFPFKRGTFFRSVLNPQGNRIYSISSSVEGKVVGKKNLIKIYYFQKDGSDWNGPNVIDFGDDFPYDAGHLSIASNGNIYFQTGYRIYGNEDIYFAKYEDGIYTVPVKLGDEINGPGHDTHPYIAPDESFLIFDANREEGFGNNDLYICFKTTDGGWTKAKNMGPKVNSNRDERRSYVTNDGKYIFFESYSLNPEENLPALPAKLREFHDHTCSYKNGSSNLYWADASLINQLRAQ